jgi:hypothetical protein
LDAVVDGVATAAALPPCLPVFEPGDDVLDAGSDSTVDSPVLVADGAAGAVAPRRGDVGVVVPR